MSDEADRGLTSHNVARSSHWHAVEVAFLASWLETQKKKHDGFEKTFEGFAWEVHHDIPFHLGVLLDRGYIELDTRNLIVVPRAPIDIHLVVAHLDDFRSFNPNVRAELRRWCGFLYGGKGPIFDVALILADPFWRRAHLHRPRPWHEMTDHDKAAVENLIDERLPIRHVEEPTP